MSFADRMDVALPHEDAVKVALEKLGWTVEKGGRGFFDARFEEIIAKWSIFNQPCLLRWWPEFQAWKGMRFALVDAKTETRADTANFSIEKNALRCYQRITSFNAFVFIVFPGMLVLDVGDVIAHQVWEDDGSDAKGSKTPFVLVPKLFAKPLTKVFT
jgi:hypothetical protein